MSKMITIEIGDLLKIELGGDEDVTTPISPALRKLNDAVGGILEVYLREVVNETFVDPAGE